MANEPDLRHILLRFRIGEYTIGSFPLHLRTTESSLTDHLTLGSYPPPLPDAGTAPGRDGWFLPCYPVSRPFRRIALVRGLIRYCNGEFPRYFVDLRIGLQAYEAKFSSKSRATLNRKVRRLRDRCGGTLDWREYRSPEDLRCFLELASGVSRLTYQERLLDAGLPSGDGFRDTAVAAAGRGAVRGYLLFVDGRPAAYLYTQLRCGSFTYDYLGYDPSYADWSVGTVLQWLVLRHLIEEKAADYFDFTAGAGEHKRFFATGSINCRDFYLLRPSPRVVLAVLGHRATTLISDGLIAIMDFMGVKAKVKLLLRQRVGRADDSKP